MTTTTMIPSTPKRTMATTSSSSSSSSSESHPTLVDPPPLKRLRLGERPTTTTTDSGSTEKKVVVANDPRPTPADTHQGVVLDAVDLWTIETMAKATLEDDTNDCNRGENTWLISESDVVPVTTQGRNPMVVGNTSVRAHTPSGPHPCRPSPPLAKTPEIGTTVIACLISFAAGWMLGHGPA